VYLQVEPLLPIWQLAPVLCVVSHEVPQAAHVALATAFSQPSVSGAVVSQSANPELQPVYEHVLPSSHEAPWLFVVSQALPHAPQLPGVASDVSHPSVSAPPVLQSAQPGWHPLYWHTIAPPSVATQVAPTLCVVSQTLPHAPQLPVDVFELSHPFVFGGA
jgi:hypothetical protein